MPNRGAILAVLLALGAAFLWGFKRDFVLSFLSPDSIGSASNSTDSPFVTPVEDPPASATTSNAGELKPSIKQVPVLPQLPGGNPPPPFPGPPVRANNLANTLDSIRPGQIPPSQVTQRNEYFEKLSQQLRELQGGTPPPPSVPNEGANVPPIPPPGSLGSDGLTPPPPPPGFPGSAPPAFPGAEPGFEGNAGQQALPQADFDQQTPGLEEDEEFTDTDEDTDPEQAE